MRQEIQIGHGVYLVIAKGEHGYQPVLDAFAVASQVTVVTFNISKKADGKLNRALEALAEHVDLRVVTNVPNRFASYWGATPRTRARETIQAYLKNLNPASFDENAQAYFNFDNHAKLVATNDIAYIGSANFSVVGQFESYPFL
jgi:phosphatidylserine/phosphatidylglycerophosphate/cardiolipin synthase-like enzyme